MRIIQISDMHLPTRDEDSRGVDTWKNLDLALDMAMSYNPDLIVFSGDICFADPATEIYESLEEKIADIDIPLRFIDGNHDSQGLIKNMIARRGESAFYPAEKLKSCSLLYLNSGNAHLSTQEYDVLERFAGLRVNAPLLVFMHHPPIKIGVPMMDSRYPFAEAEKIQRVLRETERPVHIFCGHYHNERSVYTREYSIHCTPSLYMQIDERKEEFKVLTYDIGIRIIELEAGKMTTYVRYLHRPSPSA